jgi:hypothetical protein
MSYRAPLGYALGEARKWLHKFKVRARWSVDLSKDRPSVLIVAAKWGPSSARMAVALHRHGCRVSAVCPVGHPLTHVSDISHIYPYRGISSLSSLRNALQECRPDIVIPCDEGVVAQLHSIHELDPMLRPVIENSLGPSTSYSLVESRYQFLARAIELGLPVPKTDRVRTAEDLVAWHADSACAAVLKVDGESGGNGVRIAHSLEESVAAWRELHVPYGWATAWKRLLIDRDPLALWFRQNRHGRDVTVQEFITGRPANSMLVCWRGELLSIISVIVVAAECQTGAATIVRVIQNAQMKKAAEILVARLDLSGFYGLDFVIDSATDVPYLIEMNPRCTQLGHIELPNEGCLAGILSAVLRGDARPEVRDPIPSNTIALFPQALIAGETCRRHIEASYHDLPSDEPRLMEELVRKSWPRRQWASRLYHAFNPPQRVEPILFEEIDADEIAIVQ